MQEFQDLNPAERELAEVLQSLQLAPLQTPPHWIWYQAGLRAGRRRAATWCAIAATITFAATLLLVLGRPAPGPVERIVYVPREAAPATVPTMVPPATAIAREAAPVPTISSPAVAVVPEIVPTTVPTTAPPALHISGSPHRPEIDSAAHWRKALSRLHNDPIAEAKLGFELVNDVIYPAISTYEYWDDDDGSIRAPLRPEVEMCIDLYKQLSVDAAKAADGIANTMHGNEPQINKMEQDFEDLTNLSVAADYTRWVLNYDLAVCMDPSNPARRQVCLEAIDKIKQYDDPDSAAQADVRLAMAKLYMAAGDYDMAKKEYDSVTDSDVKPPASPNTIFDAKFFKALSEFYRGNADNASQALDAADKAQTSFPAGNPAQQVAAARVDLLRYRILDLRADQATDPQVRAALNQQAMSVLQGLLIKFPNFKDVILQQMKKKQMKKKLPANPTPATTAPTPMAAPF